jgi:hypothetical protein
LEKICPKCNMESSISVRLRLDEKSGEYICPRDQTHRFKLDENGWLISL